VDDAQWLAPPPPRQYAVYTTTFDGNKKLKDFFSPLSVNHDRRGVEFVSTVESKKFPIFATQWHPEKLQFEWTLAEALDHSLAAVQAMQYMADTFVTFTRGSSHAFPSTQAEQDALVYSSADKVVYSGREGSNFEQIYFWPA
jgi:gamma-glutamyl hydrolase